MPLDLISGSCRLSDIPMQKLSHQTHSFDEFTLDLTRGCLLHGQEEIKLRPKSFEVLKYLVENNGRLISKDELIHAVWVETAVTDDSLVQCLKDIRHALRDEAQQIIKTVHGRGYIFDKEVRDNASTARATTYAEETAGVRVIIEEEETNGHGSLEMPPWPASESVGLISAHRGTSFERLATAIKQQRWAVVVGVLTLAVTTAAIVYFTRPGEAIDSLAVMPFVNVSGDPTTEYLSDGLSDSIIDSLSQLPSLKRVIARYSVLRYKGKQTDPQAVGRELNVRAVLMGQVIQRGDDLSISVELVDVRDNRHLWGAQYNRKLADALAVQQEISREITDQLRLKLTGEEQRHLTRRDPSNPEAYQFYLKGRYYWNRRTTEPVKKAMEQFREAADRDPNYALAYAGLADCYLVQEAYSGGTTSETIPKAKAFAERALQLDSSLAEAHASLGNAYDQLWQWEQAEQEFKRAIELDPNYPTAHHWYSLYLRNVGRFDEALREIKRAQELDPLSVVIASNLAMTYLVVGDVNSSIEQSKRIIDLDPNFPRGDLGVAYLTQGRYSEAIAEFQKAVDLSNRRARRPLRNLGYVCGISGKRTEALAILRELQGKYEQHQALGADVAAVYVGLGEKDQAFVWLDKDFQARSFALPRIRWEPPFDSLRSDARHADLLRRMKLAA